MKRISLAEVAEATGGVLRGPESLRLDSICTDTRSMKKGALFVALRGRRYDAHDFLEEAAAGGARAAVVSRGNGAARDRSNGEDTLPLVLVNDTLRALGDLASRVRSDMDIDVYAVTGTTGKTCTKDFLVSCLSRRMKVAGARESYNNEVGIPLTIFSAGKNDRAIVCEMGARRPGDVKRLARIALPNRGIVTNVGPGHLELFGTLENVARTKSELAGALPADGLLVLNADDPACRKMSGRSRARTVMVGTSNNADYLISDVRLSPKGCPAFALVGPGLDLDVELPVVGRHQVANAAAAAACAAEAGLDAGEIAEGLRRVRLSPWRTETVASGGGFVVINDSYNANPQSMNAALNTLKEMGGGKRTVAVLGQMAELGRDSGSYHRAAGRELVALDIDLLVTIGKRARGYASAALDAGMPRGSVFRCETVEDAEAILSELLERGDVVLVKASRVEGLERLAGTISGAEFSERDGG